MSVGVKFNFREDGLRLDLDDLTKIVNHKMTSHYAKETNLPKGSDLAPEVSHTLTKTLHFNPPNGKNSLK